MELERFTATDTGRVSVIFTWRGVGFLFGVLGLGHLFDRLHHDLLMGLSCLLVVITHCCIPLFRSIGILYIIFGGQSVAIGIIGVGEYHRDILELSLLSYKIKGNGPTTSIMTADAINHYSFRQRNVGDPIL